MIILNKKDLNEQNCVKKYNLIKKERKRIINEPIENLVLLSVTSNHTNTSSNLITSPTNINVN